MKPFLIDFYKVLGIPHTANNSEIQAAYLQSVTYYKLKTGRTISRNFYEKVHHLFIQAKQTLLFTDVKIAYLHAYAQQHNGLFPQGVPLEHPQLREQYLKRIAKENQ